MQKTKVAFQNSQQMKFLAVICVIMVKNTPTRLIFRRKSDEICAAAQCLIVEKNPAKRFFDRIPWVCHPAVMRL